jgi:hypothetical protein
VNDRASFPLSVVPKLYPIVIFPRLPFHFRTIRPFAEWLPPVILALIGIHRCGLLILPARFEHSN